LWLWLWLWLGGTAFAGVLSASADLYKIDNNSIFLCHRRHSTLIVYKNYRIMTMPVSQLFG
jgi:hypothetical protein